MRKSAAHGSLLFAIFLLVAGLGTQNATAAAPTGSVSGNVVDMNGAGIAGAKVTLESLETDTVLRAVTDRNGHYQTGELPIGRYKLSAELGNGQRMVLPVLDMSAATTPATLSTAAAQLTATVIVNAQAPMVEKTISQIDRMETTKTILELPGRQNLNGLAVLNPGVVPIGDPQFGSSFAGVVSSLNYGTAGNVLTREIGAALAANGTRPNSNYFTIDGSYNMDPVRATNRQSMPPEALHQFGMIDGNFPAQVGRYGGSYINQLSRSGNSGLHGTLMYTWAGNTFNAFSSDERRMFSGLTDSGFSSGDAYRTARSVIVNNRAVASAGFPIWKDRIFSFSSWDRDWFKATANPYTLAITDAGRANLQAVSEELAPGALDGLTAAFPVANIPVSLGQINFLTPESGTVTQVPLAIFNRGMTGGIPYDRDYWRFMQRLEIKVSDKNSLNLRYLIDDLKDPGLAAAIPGQEVGRVFRNHNGQLNDIHIFSPAVVNEFRFSIGRLADRFDSNLGTGLVIGGFNAIGNPSFPQRRKDTSYQFADFISWSIPHHTFKFGGDAVHYRMRAEFPFNENGTLTYSSLPDFLLNQNAVFSRFSGNNFLRSNATEIGIFAQDDWRAHRTLSLNFGVRYEYMQIPEGLFSGVLPSSKNFGPRFGFAWSPDTFGKWFERMTFRGGYSIMYNQQVAWQLLPLTARNFPNGINTVIGPVSNLTDLPDPISVADFLVSGQNSNLLPVTVVGTDAERRFETPYYQTYTLGVEREFMRDFLFRAYYVGTKGTHLYTQYEANPGVTPSAFTANPEFFTSVGLQPVVGPDDVIVAHRLNPDRGSIMAINPIGNSIYNSGQFSLVKRFSHGVQFGAHYTYSSAISDSDNFLIPVGNPFNLGLNRGRSDFDQPHRFVGNWVFVIPTIWRDRPLVSRLISGWEWSGITTAASGFPYTVYNTQNALGLLPGQNPSLFTQRASFNPNGIPGTATGIGVLNPMFVANPANSGVVGNLGRNLLRTGRFINTDMAFVKNTRIFTEDQSLQLRIEFFNIFNHRSLTSMPLATVNGFTDETRFLNLGQTNAPGRSMMFTARYFF